MPSLAAAQAEVAALVGASDPVHALSAAQALLASAGVLVSSDLQHPAQAPSGITVTPAQLDAIAIDGQARATVSRVTLRDLAGVLVRLGVPVHADRDPAFALEKALAAWLAAAKAHPEDPGSGAVFALAALAQRQNPPIDIGTANYDPSVLRLGLLDLELFTAGAAEATSAARQALGVGPARTARQQTATLWSAFDGLFDGRAYAADESPCAAVQSTLDSLSPLVGGTWAYAAGHVGPEAASRYAGWWGYVLSTDLSAAKANAAQVAKTMGDLLGALGVLAQVQALAELYHNTSAKLTVLTGDTVHEADEHGPDKEAKVRLIAGISDADWAKAQHSALDTFSAQVKDCLTKLGLPTTTSAQDLAGSMKGWRVRWGLENTDGAAFINGATDFAFPGDLMDYLQPLNDHQSTAVLRVGVAHEQDKDHPGDLVPVKVVVTAAVVTDALPNVGTFAGGAESASAALAADAPLAAALGVSAALAGVAAGWFQEVHTINASTVLTVTHHKFNPGLWHGTVQVTTKDVTDQVTKYTRGKFWSNVYDKVTSVRQDVLSVERVDLSQPDRALLTVADDATYEYTDDSVGSDNIGAGQCGYTPRYHETVALHSHAWEHGATPPQASVELNVVGTTGPSGRSHEYQLAVDRLPSLPPTTYFYNKNLAEYATAVDSPNCRGGQHSWSATQPPFGPGMASATVAQVFGPTDPTQPERLPGHLIGRQVFSVGSTYDGVTDSETITIAWDLQRETKPGAPPGEAK